jgi:hypothetical protein
VEAVAAGHVPHQRHRASNAMAGNVAQSNKEAVEVRNTTTAHRVTVLMHTAIPILNVSPSSSKPTATRESEWALSLVTVLRPK